MLVDNHQLHDAQEYRTAEKLYTKNHMQQLLALI